MVLVQKLDSCFGWRPSHPKFWWRELYSYMSWLLIITLFSLRWKLKLWILQEKFFDTFGMKQLFTRSPPAKELMSSSIFSLNTMSDNCFIESSKSKPFRNMKSDSSNKPTLKLESFVRGDCSLISRGFFWRDELISHERVLHRKLEPLSLVGNLDDIRFFVYFDFASTAITQIKWQLV